MHFKIKRCPWWLGILLGAALISELLGCHRYIDDQQKNQRPYELDMQGVQCLNQVPEVFRQYFQQNLDTNKLHETTVCVDKAISEFLGSTRGSDAASYQMVEVQKFFKKYIFKRDVSNDLAKEIMKLKTAMVGGTEEFITRTEFEKLRGLLKVFEIELRRLYPHLGIYLFKEPINVTVLNQKSRLDAAVIDLKIAVQNLLAGLHLADSEYSLPEVDLLLGEVEKFAGISDPLHPFSQWRRNLPTLEKLKTLLVGEVVEVRGQKEINEIWDILIDVYRLGLQYQGGVRQLNWMSIENFPEFDSWMEDLFTVLNRGFALRNKGQIPFKRIDEIVDEFYVRKLWMDPLNPETAKITYRQFIYRFLEGSDADLMSVDVRHLVQLHREYRSFKLIQIALSHVFADKERRPITEVIRVLETFDIEREIRRLSPLSLRDQIFFRQAWFEFLALVRSPGARHWDARGKVSVGFGRSESWTYEELTRMNLLRVPTSMIVRSYGTKNGLAPKDNFLNGRQIKMIFDEFEGFGDEMGLFDLRNSDSSGRSAREADLFTPSGDGDGRVQFIELFDLFTVMWSGGMVGVSDFKAMAQLEGCLKDRNDYFAWPYMEMNCASRTFHKYFSIIFPQLPKFADYAKKLQGDRWQNFFNDLLVVSRVCPKDTEGLETGDQRTMVVVLHYIENLFSVYDLDRNSRFSEEEVERAFPRFKAFMIEVTRKRVQQASPATFSVLESAGYNWSGMALDAFKFVVFKGRTPTGGELMKFMAGEIWGQKLGEADRQNIVRVFAALKSEIGSSNSVNCEARRDRS